MKLLRQRWLFLSALLFSLVATEAAAQTNKSYFPMGGITRYSNGTYYFAMSGRHYVTKGEVVTKAGEVTNCSTNEKKCAQLLSQAAKESIELDGLQTVDTDQLTGSAPVLEQVAQYEPLLADLGEDKSGIYFLDYRTQEWQMLKFFKESHVRVMKSLKRNK